MMSDFQKDPLGEVIQKRERTEDRDRYINVFGGLKSLAGRVPWSEGVSNMLEWLTWETKYVLGVSKTKYAEQIIDWTEQDAVRNGTREEKIKYVRQKLKELMSAEPSEPYAPAASGIASPKEALRRAKYFSEEYLNKEFDIFWALVSDKYLDSFYGQFTSVSGGGQWSAHGNKERLQASGIREMQIDNLTYNEAEALLVANELKLGGKKNPDQILKYALMFKRLRDKKFIIPQSRFLLLFIGATKENISWEALIQEEISFCKNSSKSTARDACQRDVIEVASSAEYASTTWSELMEFNKTYAASLHPQAQQAECKLLWGFNESLAAKACMRRK